MTDPYVVEPPHLPEADLSGDLGLRTLRLLSLQVARNLAQMEADREAAGEPAGRIAVAVPQYTGHWLGGNAYALAVLARFGTEGETMAGASRESVRHLAADVIRALA